MSTLFSNLLLAMIAALGTHMLDVIKVHDRVDMIEAEEIKNTAIGHEMQANWEHYRTVDLPTLINGQVMMNRRLCRLLDLHGKADAGCRSDLYLTDAIKPISKLGIGTGGGINQALLGGGH